MTDTPLPAAVETLRRVREDPHRLGHRGHGDGEDIVGTGHGVTGPASKRIIVGYGFWIFLLSNVLWVAWGIYANAYALIALQVCLAALNIRGVKKTTEES